MIPYGRQAIDESDIAAVVEVLRSDFLTQGPVVPLFERKVSEYCGAPYSVAVNSATSALHIACLSLGLGPGDWLWTSPNTFVASANCALYCGAKVDFVDIDPATYNLSVSELERKLVQAERDGKLPKVLVPVHFSGQPCDLKAIWELSKKYGFKVIEDASHAIGAEYLGEKIGGCTYSHMTVFSFHPVKIITTGEGGMVTTRDRTLYESLCRLRTHGITRDTTQMLGPSHGDWYYEQVALGFNYRMTDIHAALGVSQMNRIDRFIARRRELAKRYDVMLGEFPVVRPAQREDRLSAWHLYVIQLREDSGQRAAKFQSLRASGIGVNVHYIPVHLQPYYRNLGFCEGSMPACEAYYRGALSLPLFAEMTESQQDQVVSGLAKALRQGLG